MFRLKQTLGLVTFILAAGGNFVAVGNALGAAPASQVTVSSGGGVFQDAVRKSHWAYASRKTGIAFKETTSANGLNDVKLQVQSRAVSWDIVNISMGESLLGTQQGLLEPIDRNVVRTDGLLPNMVGSHCVGSNAFATVLAWQKDAFKGNTPKSWADFWDFKRFPGPRGMWNRPEGALEIALMADGVPPANVYQTLSTDAGYERAFRKLAELAPHVTVWWTSGAQHAQAIADGEVVMTTGWNGRFEVVIAAGAPVAYTFNQGVVSADCYAVPKGAPHREAAMKFIAAMMDPEPQAALARLIPYGPSNPKAFEGGLISPATARKLPTFPDNLRLEIVNSADWWMKNLDRVQKRYEKLIAQ